MMDMYYIWLTLLPGIGPVKARWLLNNYGTAQDIYLKFEDIMRSRTLWAEEYDAVKMRNQTMEKVRCVYDNCMFQNIKVITFANEVYGEEWKRIKDFPIVLYLKGNIWPKAMKGRGIIGARRCSPFAKETAVEIAADAVQQGEYVASGLAKGVDSYAHTAAIINGGFTIAVLGNGVDICYPREHRCLYDAICETGAVISEYIPQTKPKKYNFPKRNRIIAALSEKLYVIEAKEKSGTASTVAAAKNYGRTIIKI